MKPRSFAYQAHATLDEAIALLAFDPHASSEYRRGLAATPVERASRKAAQPWSI